VQKIDPKKKNNQVVENQDLTNKDENKTENI
jgi:hypothetical protein